MKPTLTASKKRVFKLVLDAVMLVLLVLMYRKQAVGMAFHEIGGLALIAAGVVVRDMRATPRLGDALRISIGSPEENAVLLSALADMEVAA